MGDVASDPDSRGSVRHRQHLQLPQTHLPLHSQLPPGAPADLTGKDAAGHPQISLHLLSGEKFSLRLRAPIHSAERTPRTSRKQLLLCSLTASLITPLYRSLMDEGHYQAISLHSDLINSLSGELRETCNTFTREPLTPSSPRINREEPEAQNPQCFV